MFPRIVVGQDHQAIAHLPFLCSPNWSPELSHPLAHSAFMAHLVGPRGCLDLGPLPQLQRRHRNHQCASSKHAAANS